MKISFIGTYPPRECGIGTFTKNLVQSMTSDVGQETNRCEELVIALSDHEQIYPYPEEVKLVIQQEQQVDYNRLPISSILVETTFAFCNMNWAFLGAKMVFIYFR